MNPRICPKFPNLRTNSFSNLVNPQILGLILGQVRPQLLQQLHGHIQSQICGQLCPRIWGVTKFSHIFWENISKKWKCSRNSSLSFGTNFPQISWRVYSKNSCKFNNRHHPSLQTIFLHEEDSLVSIIIPSRMTSFFIPILYICKLQFVCPLLFIISFFFNCFDQLRIGLLLWCTF